MDKPIRILLAEDDVNLGKVLTTYLEVKGYTVGHASNGEMAYDMFCSDDYNVSVLIFFVVIRSHAGIKK